MCTRRAEGARGATARLVLAASEALAVDRDVAEAAFDLDQHTEGLAQGVR
jgi:hypothetical protein